MRQSPHWPGAAACQVAELEGLPRALQMREGTAHWAARKRCPARPPAPVDAYPLDSPQLGPSQGSSQSGHGALVVAGALGSSGWQWGWGRGGWTPWGEAGQGVGEGVGVRYTRGGRWLQRRGAPVGGWVLKGKGGA